MAGSKRRQNPAVKALRARSWLRGEERKKLHRTIQDEAHKTNMALKQAGLPTPWARSRHARAERQRKTA